MYSSDMLPTEDFSELEELQKLEYGTVIRHSPDYVLSEPRYKGRHSRDSENFGHYWFSMDNMKAKVHLFELFEAQCT